MLLFIYTIPNSTNKCVIMIDAWSQILSFLEPIHFNSCHTSKTHDPWYSFPTWETESREKALVFLSRKRFVARLRYCIQKSPTDVNVSKGRLMFDAVAHDDVDLVKFLMRYGAQIDLFDTPGAHTGKENYSVPLIEAIKRGHMELVNVFMEAGADLCVCWYAPFYRACEYGHYNLAMTVFRLTRPDLQSIYNIKLGSLACKAIKKHDATLLQFVISLGFTDDMYSSTLNEAIQSLNTSLIKLLLPVSRITYSCVRRAANIYRGSLYILVDHCKQLAQKPLGTQFDRIEPIVLYKHLSLSHLLQ